MTSQYPSRLKLTLIFLSAFVCILLSTCQSGLSTTTPVANHPTTDVQTSANPPNETPAAPPAQIGAWPLSADGKWLVAKSSSGAWWMWDTTSKKPVYLLSDNPSQTGRYMHHTIFSPDARFIAAITMGHVLIWEIATHERRILMSVIPADYQSMRQLVFSPNSNFIAVNDCQKLNNRATCSDGFVNLWNTDNGNLRYTVGAGFPVEKISFSTDSTTFSIAGCSQRDGGGSGYCYEQSQAVYKTDDGQLITLKCIPQF